VDGEGERLGHRVATHSPGKALHRVPLTCFLHGVTFLAFGNGAPDIFSAMVAFSDPRTASLAIGALFGKCDPSGHG
jgi:Ca2+/Na+ antiporter